MTCVASYVHKVQIDTISATAQDAHGHVDKTAAASWTKWNDAWCRVQSKGGREFWKVDQVAADVSHVWWCQWSPTLNAITTEMRIVYEGNTYEILSAVDVNLAHEEIEIQTRRAV